MNYKNDDNELIAIGVGTNYGIYATMFLEKPCLTCSDTTARYIEKLPEIVELLKALSEYSDNWSPEAKAIITYAEGKQDD